MPRIPDHIDRTDYEAIADWIESDDFDPGEWKEVTAKPSGCGPEGAIDIDQSG